MARDVAGQRLEADGITFDEVAIVELLGDDDVHHRERERRVGAGPEDQDLVGLRGGFGLAHVDGYDARAAAPGGGHVARRVRLRREVGAPQHDQRAVYAHVLLGIRLEQAGEAEAEGAQAPADHRRAPPLAAVEIGEPAEQMRRDARAVVVREDPVSRPRPDGLAAGRAHPRDDQVERLAPARTPPFTVAPAVADQRVEQALRVADDLA